MATACFCHGQLPPLERDAFAAWVEHLAQQQARRYPPVDFDDVKAAAWWGAVRAFDAYEHRPGGQLLPFVMQRMRWAITDWYREDKQIGAASIVTRLVLTEQVEDAPVVDAGFDEVEEAQLVLWARATAAGLFDRELLGRHRYVARRRYLDGADNPTIAAELGCDRTRVAQLARPGRLVLAGIRDSERV